MKGTSIHFALFSLLLIWVAPFNVAAQSTGAMDSVRLKHGEIVAPFVIAFPEQHQYQSVRNPAVPEIMMHYFTAQDMVRQIGYGVSIMTLPPSFGQIDDDTAAMMLEEAIGSQITVGDLSHGDDRVVVDLELDSLEGRVSRYYLVTRNTRPKIFSAYLAFMRARTMVSLWFTATDTPSNRKAAESYYLTLDID